MNSVLASEHEWYFNGKIYKGPLSGKSFERAFTKIYKIDFEELFKYTQIMSFLSGDFERKLPPDLIVFFLQSPNFFHNFFHHVMSENNVVKFSKFLKDLFYEIKRYQRENHGEFSHNPFFNNQSPNPPHTAFAPILYAKMEHFRQTDVAKYLDHNKNSIVMSKNRLEIVKIIFQKNITTYEEDYLDFFDQLDDIRTYLSYMQDKIEQQEKMLFLLLMDSKLSFLGEDLLKTITFQGMR